MPTKINVMFDNFSIQTWTKLLVSFKMYTWFTEKKHTKQTKQKNKKQKNTKKKIQKTQNIYESLKHKNKHLKKMYCRSVLHK